MNLNSENKQAIHEVMIADMQQRLYEDGKGIMFRWYIELCVAIIV